MNNNTDPREGEGGLEKIVKTGDGDQGGGLEKIVSDG